MRDVLIAGRKQMSNILLHTPIWVFALFIGLIALGYLQTRPRSVSLTRLLMLPLAMLALSFSGVWNTLGGTPLGIVCWLAALVVAVVGTQFLHRSDGIRYHTESQSFSMPGSWLPLCLMMGIFFTKYAVGASLAVNSELRESSTFIAFAASAYGFWSGIFLGRVIQLFSVHRRYVFSGSRSA